MDVNFFSCPASDTVDRDSLGNSVHLLCKGRRLGQRILGQGGRADTKRERGMVQLLPVHR
jgi:hypothetical protein